MVLVKLQEGEHYSKKDKAVVREINLRRVPVVGEVFYFMDSGPELDYHKKVSKIVYRIEKSKPKKRENHYSTKPIDIGHNESQGKFGRTKDFKGKKFSTDQ